MSKAALLELADRVEKASGSDRELDAAIFETIGLTELQERHCKDWCRQNGRTDLTRERYVSAWAPDFTRSLDAAMTLLPTGFAVSVEWSPAFPGHAWLYPPDNINDVSFESVAAAPALALTAACLRARAQQESKDA